MVDRIPIIVVSKELIRVLVIVSTELISLDIVELNCDSVGVSVLLATEFVAVVVTGIMFVRCVSDVLVSAMIVVLKRISVVVSGETFCVTVVKIELV